MLFAFRKFLKLKEYKRFKNYCDEYVKLKVLGYYA